MIRLWWRGVLCGKGREGVFILVLLVGVGGAAQGQAPAESVPFCREEARRAVSLDTRGLGAVYCTTSPVLTGPLQVAHASARPLFYGAVPLAWGVAFLRQDDSGYASAYRLTFTQGITYGIVLGLKRAVGRPRPYVHRALDSRSGHHSASKKTDAYTSFPSGHAALSAALATSWTLSYPEWYVAAPGAAWAVAVSLSRLHLGVHYPSDVLVGAGIGIGMAVLVHQIRGIVTPEIVTEGPWNGISAPPPVTVRFRF